jgi:hypothetical protein
LGDRTELIEASKDRQPTSIKGNTENDLNMPIFHADAELDEARKAVGSCREGVFVQPDSSPGPGNSLPAPDEAPFLGTAADGSIGGEECSQPAYSPADRRSPTGESRTTLRVATFNAKFLFDGISDPSASRWLDNPTGAVSILS